MKGATFKTVNKALLSKLGLDEVLLVGLCGILAFAPAWPTAVAVLGLLAVRSVRVFVERARATADADVLKRLADLEEFKQVVKNRGGLVK